MIRYCESSTLTFAGEYLTRDPSVNLVEELAPMIKYIAVLLVNGRGV